MAIKKSELYSSLWQSCDALRGGMDASQYKDYVLVLLFIKYVSDKYAGKPYQPLTIPPGASFADMVALKGIDESVWSIVRAHLAQDLSPEQIVGSAQVSISHERIYQYVAADRKAGGSLWLRLRCRKRRRQRRCGTPRQRQRFGGRPIVQRPAIVQARHRVGDWEGDTIVGKGTVRIVTLVERKTGLARIRRVTSGEAEPTMRAILHALHPIGERVHTLTWDNGSEFADHALIDIALDATSYFAEPYSAWQRGCNENLNGLLRQYFPKGCNLGAFTDDDIQLIEDKLNQRPRKRLGFRTPQHLFDLSFKRGALRS